MVLVLLVVRYGVLWNILYVVLDGFLIMFFILCFMMLMLVCLSGIILFFFGMVRWCVCEIGFLIFFMR